MGTKHSVWNEVLLKRASNAKLKKARTVPQDNAYEYQIFEVMVAEALNLCDRNASWEVTKGGNDSGIDLIGTEKQIYNNPLDKHTITKKILGQVKRFAGRYSFHQFCGDLTKVQKYCINTEFYDENALLSFVFVLSTDIEKGVQNLRSRIKKEMDSKNDSVFINSRPAHIQIRDASELMRIWKMNFSHFEYILDEALSPTQLQILKEFLDEIDFSWISISVAQEQLKYTGQPFELHVTITTNMEYTDVDMYVKWYPPPNNTIQLLEPLMALDPRQGGFPLRIHKTVSLRLVLRSLEAGKFDCGTLEFLSSDNTRIIRHPLGEAEFERGFFPLFFGTPNHGVLIKMENSLADLHPDIVSYVVVGCGGIGKTTLLKELMIHAAERGYICIDIAQPKDLLHPRFLLRALFRRLIDPNAFKISFENMLLSETRNFLHSDFKEDWVRDLDTFFLEDEKECDIHYIIECLSNVLVKASKNSPVFIWLSDVHMASQETLMILSNVIESLTESSASLFSKIIFILEGRNNERILINGFEYDSRLWSNFTQNSKIKKLEMSLWTYMESMEFLKRIFVNDAKETYIYEDVCKKILNHSNGVPMHILEHIRLLIDLNKLALGTSQRLLIVDYNFSDCFSDEIIDTIKNRVNYFRQNYSDFIDILAITAAHLDVLNPELFQKIVKYLKTLYPDYNTIIKSCGFVNETKSGFVFLHEYYLSVFSTEAVVNENLLELCLNFYNQKDYLNEQDAFHAIRLKGFRNNTDSVEYEKDAISLLNRTRNLMLRFALYMIFLEISERLEPSEKLPKYKIYFELCEISIRTGSWERGEDYLRKTLELINYDDIENLKYQVMAYQELSNCECDKMCFDKAIKSAHDGLELAELCLSKKSLSDEHRSKFDTLYEKLLARLAVCYWFSGDFTNCKTYQDSCLEAALKRNDNYSTAHVGYEIGTFKFHEELDEGIMIIEDILDRIESIPALNEHEKSLIEVQLLIGKIIKATRQDDKTLLREVKLETRRLLEIYKYEKHIYEEFICYTIRAVCFYAENNNEQALCWLFESMKCATTGEMPNLIWKAYYNIAQLYRDLSDMETAQKYALKACKILIEAYSNNPETATCFRLMIRTVVKKLECILGDFNIQELRCQDEVIGNNLLSAIVGTCEFVIMN